MKKALLCMFVMLFSLIAACGTDTVNPTASPTVEPTTEVTKEPNTTPTIEPTEVPTATANTTETPTAANDIPVDPTWPIVDLTPDEPYWAIATTWLDQNAENPDYKIYGSTDDVDKLFTPYALNGNQYYGFGTDNAFDSWIGILVNEKIGESMLFMRYIEGDRRHTIIGWLDDYFTWQPALLSENALSLEEAIEKYEAWRAIDEYDCTYPLSHSTYGYYELFGELYYYLVPENETLYWYNILVHSETGEMLNLLQTDGMCPETIFTPIDEWYADTAAYFTGGGA